METVIADPMARFNCATLDEAKAIILMPEADLTPEQRWEKETAWLMPRLVVRAGPVLDFGCGIGRIAKHLAGPACPVLGIDISPTMRQQATEYVKSDYFRAASPDDLDQAIAGGYRAQTIICVWILQHLAEPGQEIARLARAAKPGAELYLLNRANRAIPMQGGWVDDGVSIAPLLWMAGFKMLKAEAVPTELCAPGAMFQRWTLKGLSS